MARNIIGVIVGYLSMSVFMFITFTGLYFALGADGAFEPGSYKVSSIWIIASILIGILTALLGGWIAH